MQHRTFLLLAADLVITGIAALAHGQCGEFSFRDPAVYPTDDYVYSVTPGDIDGDGDLDLVALQFHRPSPGFFLRVLLNRGDGSFDQRGAIPFHGFDIQLADLRGLGRADLISREFQPSRIIVNHFNADGTIGPDVEYPIIGDVAAFATGDVTGDGVADVVVATLSYPAYPVVMLEGVRGGVPLAPRDLVRDQGRSSGISIADLDGDGLNDLVQHGFWYDPSPVWVQLATAAGVFAPRVQIDMGENVRDVLITDLDGDGLPDLVSKSWFREPYASGFSVRFGLGGDAFAPLRFYPVEHDSYGPPIAADFDGDGRLDLASSWDALRFSRNHGGRVFGPFEDLPFLSPYRNYRAEL